MTGLLTAKHFGITMTPPHAENRRLAFFSVLRLLGFRQVVAHVRHCISELCRNMLSLLIGSIKREHGPIHSPVYVHRRCKTRDKKTQKSNKAKHKTQTKTETTNQRQHRRMDKSALVELQQLVC